MTEKAALPVDELDAGRRRLSARHVTWQSPLTWTWERAVGVIGIAAAIIAFAITVRAHFLAHPGFLAVQKADFILGPIGVGLYWHHRRPHNRLGLLLIAYGLVCIPYVLASTSSPWLFTTGTMAEAVIIPLSITLVLAFPSGRLDGLPERLIIAGALLGYTVPYVVWLLASPEQLIPRLSLSGCRDVCPENPFAIWSTPSWYPWSVDYLRVALICVDMAAIVVVLSRFVHATPPRRRALAIGAPIALIYLVAQILYQTHHLLDSRYAQPTVQNLTGPYQWTIAVARAAPWYGFLFALIAAELYAGRVLRTLIRDALRRPTLRDLEGMLRRPLGDPGLRLGFRNSATRGWVDADGGVLTAGKGQRLTEFDRESNLAVAVVHDEQLAEDPELLGTAAEVALLALEHTELEAAQKESLRELSASRARIVQAGDRERRKLELDLHDGAQQRLLAVQMKLAHLRERTDDRELSTELDQIGADAASAIDELRKLAHGIYPVELRDNGVGAGLRTYVGSAPLPIEVVDRGLGRCEPEVEACIYFCALEAVQNAVKHGGREVRVTIVLDREADSARFAVNDDGVGFEAEAAGEGLGLVSMRDRLAALGGDLTISSVPGDGTSVRGAIPLHVSQVEAGSRTDDPVPRPGAGK